MTRRSRVGGARLNYEEGFNHGISEDQSPEDENSGDESWNDEDMINTATAPRRSARISSSRTYTHQVIQAILKAECPLEFAKLPNIDTIAFETWAVPKKRLTVLSSDKRLRFGTVDSPIPDVRKSVFIHISGAGSNRVCLTHGDQNEKFDLEQAYLVAPSKPYWYLCSHGRVFNIPERERMRALTCYLFLAAGHITTIEHYIDFRKDIVDAVTWYGRGVEVESSSDPEKGNIPASSNGPDDGPTQGASAPPAAQHHMIPAPAQSKTISQSDQEASDELCDALPVRKKIKLDDTTTRMIHCYNRLGQAIKKHKDESAVLRRSIQSAAVLEQRISDQREEIDILKAQLNSESPETQKMKVKISRLIEEQQELNKRVDSKSLEVAMKEAERAEEEKKRHDAENRLKKLKEILEQ